MAFPCAGSGWFIPLLSLLSCCPQHNHRAGSLRAHLSPASQLYIQHMMNRSHQPTPPPPHHQTKLSVINHTLSLYLCPLSLHSTISSPFPQTTRKRCKQIESVFFCIISVIASFACFIFLSIFLVCNWQHGVAAGSNLWLNTSAFILVITDRGSTILSQSLMTWTGTGAQAGFSKPHNPSW